MLSSFAWHPTQQNNLVAITKGGRLVQAAVPERITPSWSNRQNLVWPYRGTLRSFDGQSNFFEGLYDISKVMRKRANENVFHNRMNPESLRKQLDHGAVEALVWVERSKHLMADPNFRNQFARNTTFPGVRTALGLERTKPQFPLQLSSSPLASTSMAITSSTLSSNLGSDITYGYWDMPYGSFGSLMEDGSTNFAQLDPNMMRPKKVYQGYGRERTLKICGWGADNAELGNFLVELEKCGQYERASAVATFCLQLRKATEILRRGGTSNKITTHHSTEDITRSDDQSRHDLSVVAMALSGFSEERSGNLWREMVSTSHREMSNPYLRAMFTFLLAVSATGGTSNSNDNFLNAILEENILASDKIAFCCLHLPDQKLNFFVNDCWKTFLDRGDLGGFYICGGASHESVELLQRYVDRTGDVQTASWLSVKALTSELVLGEQVKFWIDSYKNLLDSWALYSARVELDNAMNLSGISSNEEYQIYISCSYCQNTICRSDAQIRKHLTNMPVGADGGATATPVKEEQQRLKRQVQGTPKSQQNQGQLQQQIGNPISRYRSAAMACSQGNIRSEMCPSCRKPLPR